MTTGGNLATHFFGFVHTKMLFVGREQNVFMGDGVENGTGGTFRRITNGCVLLTTIETSCKACKATELCDVQ